MDAFTKLREIFPEADEDTRLVLIGPSVRIRIGKNTVVLREYEIGGGKYIHAGFIKERNTIVLRLGQFSHAGIE